MPGRRFKGTESIRVVCTFLVMFPLIVVVYFISAALAMLVSASIRAVQDVDRDEG